MDHYAACFAEVFEVTQQQAMREVLRHGASWLEFLRDIGECDTYRSADVLRWLGY